MKKLIAGVLAVAALSSATGCAYSGVATSGDKAVILRNDGFLFGLLRKAVVCKIADAGLQNCGDNNNP
ncbi:MAG: hypothetical protein HOO96_38050 [Polyangiaceae bacterium]|jgi:hypothetical protein|nr:hypothetical protein [Polyangiaceae bacterium]